MGIKEKWRRWWNGYLRVKFLKDLLKIMEHNLPKKFNSWYYKYIRYNCPYVNKEICELNPLGWIIVRQCVIPEPP
jgi:hypothetical protein